MVADTVAEAYTLTSLLASIVASFSALSLASFIVSFSDSFLAFECDDEEEMRVSEEGEEVSKDEMEVVLATFIWWFSAFRRSVSLLRPKPSERG